VIDRRTFLAGTGAVLLVAPLAAEGQQAVKVPRMANQELLIFFVLILPYLIATFGLVPYAASAKGRSGLGWLLIALVVTPLLSLLTLAAIPDTGGPVLVKLDDSAAAEDVLELKWRKEAN
jgi:hypothetical protein